MNIFIPLLLSLTLNLGVTDTNFTQGIKVSANTENFTNIDFSLNSTDFKELSSFGLAVDFPFGLGFGIGHFDANKILFHKASPSLSAMSQSVITNTLSAKNPFTVPSFESSSKTFAVGINYYSQKIDFGICFDQFDDSLPTRFSTTFGFNTKLQKINLLNELSFVLFEYSEDQNQNTWFTKKSFTPKTNVPLIILQNSGNFTVNKTTLKLGNELRLQDSPFNSLLICNTTEFQLKTKPFQLDFGILVSDYEFIFANQKNIAEPLKIKLDTLFFFDKTEVGIQNVGLYYFYKLKDFTFYNDFMIQEEFNVFGVKLEHSINVEDFIFGQVDFANLETLDIKSEVKASYKSLCIELEDKAQNLQTSVKVSFTKKPFSVNAKTTIKDYAFLSQNLAFLLDFKSVQFKNTLEYKLDSKNQANLSYNLVGTVKM